MTCAVEACIEQVRKDKQLPKDALVPVAIKCGCPKCNDVRC